jgi:hypothetical protein
MYCLGAWLIGAAPVFGQTLPDPAPPKALAESKLPPGVLAPSSSPCDLSCASRPNPNECYRFWARGEYLLWWVKDAPMPVPIVTTGNPNVGFNGGVFAAVNIAGAIGQPGTQVQFGGNDVNFHAFSGMRFALGGWIDSEALIGLEGSAFRLEKRANNFAAGSDATGNPPLYFPINSVFLGSPAGVPIADPLRLFSGDVFITSTLQLWGAELNGVFTLWRRPGLDVLLLTGFRYADLRENFSIHNTTTDLLLGNVETLDDEFGARNQFYGGQLGTRIAWQRNAFSLDLTGKVALGSTHQVVNIQGSSAETPLLPAMAVGGLFAQPSNIGERSHNEFTVMPAIEFKVAYQLTQRVKAFAGYDFLYWSQVVRPGNQINPTVNLTQNGILDPRGAGGVLVGPAQPTPLFNRSDFWAHGVNFGLEFRF